MRKLITVFLAITAIALTGEVKADKWTKNDTAWEVAYLTSHLADWGQTLDIASQCKSGTYTETNVVMGECPNVQTVNAYFLGTALLHMTVAHMLPSKYRRGFQTSTLAMQVGFVANNANIGLNFKF